MLPDAGACFLTYAGFTVIFIALSLNFDAPEVAYNLVLNRIVDGGNGSEKEHEAL